MTDIEERIKKEYKDNFDPKDFLEFKLEGLEKAGYNYDFWFECLYEYFTTEKFSGDRLLDLGSGPTVHNIATASKYFSHIILSDFVEKNCEELRKWIRRDSDRLDWTPFLKLVAKAEKQTDLDLACKEYEDKICSSVKNIIHCDVLDDQLIAEEYARVPFDVILTSLTLEVAAPDRESYSKMLGRIHRLLKKGGKLLLLGLIKCPFWICGNNKFHCLPFEEDDIQKALEINGFSDIKRKTQTLPKDCLPFRCTKVYFITCSKL